jgi:hypothetical protein
MMELQDWTIALAGIMAIKAQGDKAQFTVEEVDHAFRTVMHQMLIASMDLAAQPDHQHPHDHDHPHPHTH